MKHRFRRGYLRELAEWVEDAQEALNVRDWRVTISDEIHDDDDGKTPSDAALIWIADYRRVGKIHLGRDWGEDSPEEQRHALTHELCHLILDRLWIYHDHELGAQVGINSWRSFHSRWHKDAEIVVNEIAFLLAPTLPLPPPLKPPR